MAGVTSNETKFNYVTRGLVAKFTYDVQAAILT